MLLLFPLSPELWLWICLFGVFPMSVNPCGWLLSLSVL